MGYDTTPGNLFWDNHTGQYLLCVATPAGRGRVIAYPYLNLVDGPKPMRVLTLQEGWEVYNQGDDLNPLERQCCIEFLGRVNKNQMLQSEPRSLLSHGPVMVWVPKRFHVCLR